jgi:hypothetical protein
LGECGSGVKVGGTVEGRPGGVCLAEGWAQCVGLFGFVLLCLRCFGLLVFGSTRIWLHFHGSVEVGTYTVVSIYAMFLKIECETAVVNV